jgi:aspartyl-tRNA(Asn)/glutamyl-tRNA(Gln) amidotransferase subunit C
MVELNEKELDKLTELSRIDCNEEEKKRLLSDLKRILVYMEQLGEVSTDNIAPCTQILEGVANVLREDAIGEILPRDLFLANAPAHVGGMVRVPPVIKFNNP